MKPTNDRRTTVGIVSLVLMGASAMSFAFPSLSLDWQPVAASGLRIGLLLGLLWLAYPDLSSIAPWLWSGLIVAAVLIAWRPRLAIIVLPLLGVLWLLKRR